MWYSEDMYTPGDFAAKLEVHRARLAEAERSRLESLHARCEKKSYETEHEARKGLSAVREVSTELRVPIRYYTCDRCSFFHLTSWPAPSK